MWVGTTQSTEGLNRAKGRGRKETLLFPCRRCRGSWFQTFPWGSTARFPGPPGCRQPTMSVHSPHHPVSQPVSLVSLEVSVSVSYYGHVLSSSLTSAAPYLSSAHSFLCLLPAPLVSTHLPVLDISCKWNHAACGLQCPASFT